MRSDPWKDRGTQRVESLRKVQTARRGFRFSQYRNVRIRRYLEDGDSCRQKNQRNEKKGERRDLCRGKETETSDNHRE